MELETLDILLTNANPDVLLVDCGFTNARPLLSDVGELC